MRVNYFPGPAQQTAAFQVSLPYRDGCENHPLATDMPALFFPESRVFDAWSPGVETPLQDGTAESLFLAR